MGSGAEELVIVSVTPPLATSSTVAGTDCGSIKLPLVLSAKKQVFASPSVKSITRSHFPIVKAPLPPLTPICDCGEAYGPIGLPTSFQPAYGVEPPKLYR